MKNTRILLLLAMAVLAFGPQPSVAQNNKPQAKSETSVNNEYQTTILNSIRNDVSQRQRKMQKQAEAILLKLPLDRKLYDESEVRVRARIADGVKEDGTAELNFVLEISYNCNHPEGFTDDYAVGTYTVESSNSVYAICELARVMIDNECSDFFGANKDVDIHISGSTDAIDVANITYNGEYGEHRYDAATFNGERVRLSISQAEGITNNAQLAYVRALGVRNYTETKISALQHTNNSYTYETTCNAEVGSRYRRCSIELTVHGAFDETIVRMNDDLTTNDDYIEFNIPVNEPNANTETYALIIANERYDAPFPNCEYAWRDGNVVRDYCIKTLSIPERHVKVLNNAGKNDIKTQGINWLKDILTASAGKSNVLLYYSGHGLTDANYNAYLLPCGIDTKVVKSWNGKKAKTPKEKLSKKDTKNLLQQCLSLDTLCSWFNRVPAKSVTFIIDAGYDGKQRSGDTLVNIKHNNVRIKGMRIRSDIVLFTAAEVNKTAYNYDAQKHGFLTYFLVRELKRKKGNVSYGELFEGAEKAIRYESSLEGRLQAPVMVLGGKMKDAWTELRFR